MSRGRTFVKHGLELLGGMPQSTLTTIVQDTVGYNESNVLDEVLTGGILPTAQFRLSRRQVHWFLDNGQITSGQLLLR
jgi:hypothetical protein